MNQINPAQQWLLKYFLSPYEWYDRLLFTVEKPIVLSAIQKTLEYLILRHDGLRMYFNYKNGWTQEFNNETKNIAPFLFSAENLELDEYVKIRDELGLKFCKEFDITKWPLIKLIIFRRGSHEYEFMFLFHHIIIDYFSCLTFFKEFCEVYALVLEDKQPSFAITCSNFDYRNKINSAQKNDWKDFWDNSFQDVKLNLSSMPSNECFAKTIERRIPPDLGEVILRKGKLKFKTKSLHFILAAPLYRAIHQLYGEAKVIVSHKLHGRNIKDDSFNFFSTVGNFAINVPIQTNISSLTSWPFLIETLDKKMASLPLKGLSYDLCNTKYYPDHLLTFFRFNFLGNISFVAPPGIKISFKEIARRIVNPSQPLTSYVEFFIHFFEKSLHLEVRYDSKRFDEMTIEMIVNSYVSNIKDLINFLEGQ